MPSPFVPRTRKVRILATLGPASNSPDLIRQLIEAGADAFRINMSHGSHEDHHARIEMIRGLEKELERHVREEAEALLDTYKAALGLE